MSEGVRVAVLDRTAGPEALATSLMTTRYRCRLSRVNG